MASLAKRLVSFATAIAVSGSPAVISACMALCLQAGPVAAMPMEHAAAARPPAQEADPVATSGHAHHATPASDATPREHSSSPESSGARLVAPCGECCPDGQVSAIARMGEERTGVQKLAAAASVSPLASGLPTTVVGAASSSVPPVPPPSPPRAPLVLRI